MSRAKWPDGCAVVSDHNGVTLEVADIGTGIFTGMVALRHFITDCGWCDAGDWFYEHPSQLKPLTPTAVAMLAIAKAGAK